MSACTNASYRSVRHMVDPRNRDFSRSIDPKKKLDSEKRGLLSFGEIAVDRASRVRDGFSKEPLALDPIKREGRGRTTTLVIAYRPWADMIG